MRSSYHPGSENRGPRTQAWSRCPLHPDSRPFYPSPTSLTLKLSKIAPPSSIYPKHQYPSPSDPTLSTWAQTPPSSFLPPSPQPSLARARPHLEMLLKTNWQNLGHGAVGCMVSSCHWGCGAAAARALQGRGGEGGGGRLGSARYSPGTQETGRQTKELGSGAEAPGSGRAAMAEPGAAQTPETAEPCGGIPTTELRPSHLTPSALCTPPRSAAVQWGAGIRGAVRRGHRLLLRHEGKLEDSKGLLFWTHHFPQTPAFPPPAPFFCILPHHATSGDRRHFRGRLGPTHVLPGARDAGREGSPHCWQNAERVLGTCRVSWECGGCWAALRNGGAIPFPFGPCLFKLSPLRRGRGVGKWAQPPALSVTQGNGLLAERFLGSRLQHSSPAYFHTVGGFLRLREGE